MIRWMLSGLAWALRGAPDPVRWNAEPAVRIPSTLEYGWQYY